MHGWCICSFYKRNYMLTVDHITMTYLLHCPIRLQRQLSTWIPLEIALAIPLAPPSARQLILTYFCYNFKTRLNSVKKKKKGVVFNPESCHASLKACVFTRDLWLQWSLPWLPMRSSVLCQGDSIELAMVCCCPAPAQCPVLLTFPRTVRQLGSSSGCSSLTTPTQPYS